MLSPAPGTAYALTGGKIFDGSVFLTEHCLVIAGETIAAVIPQTERPSTLAPVSVDGMIISAGFVDLQVNGCGGVLFNDCLDFESLDRMRLCNLASGCTSFLPTLVTTSEDDMLRAMRLVREYRAQRGPGGVLGIHLEGPYISKTRKGIHNAAHIRPLSRAMRDHISGLARELPILLTLAPECVDPDDIQELAASGVTVSIGHSNATYEQAQRGIAAGARVATHLFNAMSQWESREPGVAGAVLESSGVDCGIIADGRHLHFATIRLVKKIKGNKCFLVSDATPAVGTDLREFDFCGQTVYVRGDRCVNADGTLGGSSLTMLRAVENCVRHAGIPAEEALRMASVYPARVMDLENVLGCAVPGAYADLAVFSPESFRLAATVDKGVLIPFGHE